MYWHVVFFAGIGDSIHILLSALLSCALARKAAGYGMDKSIESFLCYTHKANAIIATENITQCVPILFVIL